MDVPLNRQVTVYDDTAGSPVTVTVSNFCNECGATRGPTTTKPFDTTTGQHWLTSWDNPCGHDDTCASILNEVALHCRRPGCFLTVSFIWQPYCSDDCLIMHANFVAATLRGFSDTLNTMGEGVHGIHNFEVDPGPLRTYRNQIQKDVGQAEALIANARDNLTNAANHLEQATRRYTTHFDRDTVEQLIANHLDKLARDAEG